MDPEPLVLSAGEDGGEHVAGHEEEEEEVVQAGVAVGVEDGEADEADGADEGEGDAGPAQDFLGQAGVAGKAAAVAEVAFGGEGEVEEDGCDDAAGDEERFEAGGAYVGDVGDGLVGFHGGVFGAGEDYPAEEHG